MLWNRLQSSHLKYLVAIVELRYYPVLLLWAVVQLGPLVLTDLPYYKRVQIGKLEDVC